MIQRIILIIFSGVIGLFAVAGAEAHSQSVGVAPASVEAKVKRGSAYTQTFTLSNNSDQKMRFSCSVNDYWYDEQNTRIIGNPGSYPRSASLWVQFSPSEVIIEPGGSGTVKGIISVPQSASGGYYTMSIFEATPVQKDSGSTQANAITASASIGVRFRGLMMLTVEDSAEYNVEILGGKATPPTESTPLEMAFDIRNRSTAHVRLQGMFALLNGSGKLAGRGRVEAKRYLPGQHMILQAPWAGELAPGHYTAVMTFKYERAGLDPATLVYELPFEVK